ILVSPFVDLRLVQEPGFESDLLAREGVARRMESLDAVHEAFGRRAGIGTDGGFPPSQGSCKQQRKDGESQDAGGRSHGTEELNLAWSRLGKRSDSPGRGQ